MEYVKGSGAGEQARAADRNRQPSEHKQPQETETLSYEDKLRDDERAVRSGLLQKLGKGLVNEKR